MLLSFFSNITYYLLLVIPYFSINQLFTARRILPYSDIWDKIPDSLTMESGIWTIAPSNRLESFLKFQDQTLYENSIKKIVAAFQNASENEKENFLSKIPDSVKLHPSLLIFLQPTDKINVLVTRIKALLTPHNPSLDSLVNDLLDCIPKVENFNWSKLPSELLKRDKIWELAPTKVKFLNILEQISYSNENITVNALLLFLNKLSDAEKLELISHIPERLKYNPKIFSIFSIDQQMILLRKKASLLEEEQITIIQQITQDLHKCKSIYDKNTFIVPER
jgi:hypothetical protein